MTGVRSARTRIAAAAVLAVLGLGVGWTPATATVPAATPGDEATIDHALPVPGAVRLLVTVPGADPIDVEGVEVSLGNEDVDSEATAASSTDEIERTSILAIDTSASMAGRRIAEAKKAAAAYLDEVPANVRVGVLTFDNDVEVVVPPGLDRDTARATIAGLRLTRDTALYDGVLGALDAAGPGGADAGQRKILVLSDGKDTTTTPLSDVLEKIEESGATVDVVSLQQGDAANRPLDQLAQAGRGTVFTTADPAALTTAFAEEADALARQVVVTAEVPAGSDDTSANMRVTVPTEGASFTATAYVPVRSQADIDAAKAAAAAPRPVEAGPLAMSDTAMFAAVGALGLGLLGLVAALAMGSNKPAADLTLAEQVRAYGVMAVPGQSGPRTEAAPTHLSGQARQVAEKALANNRNLETRIAHALEGAGVTLRPSEWLLLRAAITVLGGFIGVLLGAGNVLIGLLFILAALIGPTLYLRMKKGARLKAFSSGLADTLQLMSGSLSAGLSLAQSVDTIVREGSEPISSEFRRVVVESRLGVPLEDSLEGVAERMESRDFEWVVMAIRIQREVGGNLAELLLTVAATLREREYLRRHVKALSAEGRLSCYILGGLPPGFMVYLALAKPEYVKPMYTTPIGWAMCAGMAVLLSVGVLWMSKVAKVDV